MIARVATRAQYSTAGRPYRQKPARSRSAGAGGYRDGAGPSAAAASAEDAVRKEAAGGHRVSVKQGTWHTSAESSWSGIK